MQEKRARIQQYVFLLFLFFSFLEFEFSQALYRKHCSSLGPIVGACKILKPIPKGFICAVGCIVAMLFFSSRSFAMVVLLIFCARSSHRRRHGSHPSVNSTLSMLWMKKRAPSLKRRSILKPICLTDQRWNRITSGRAVVIEIEQLLDSTAKREKRLTNHFKQ